MATAIEYGLVAALVAVAAIATTSRCSQEEKSPAPQAVPPAIQKDADGVKLRENFPIPCGKKVVGSPSLTGNDTSLVIALNLAVRDARPGENFETIWVGYSLLSRNANKPDMPLWRARIEEHACPASATAK